MSDIVKRLMDYTTCTDSDIDEAAKAITALREQVRVLREERDLEHRLHVEMHERMIEARRWLAIGNQDCPLKKADAAKAMEER